MIGEQSSCLQSSNSPAMNVEILISRNIQTWRDFIIEKPLNVGLAKTQRKCSRKEPHFYYKYFSLFLTFIYTIFHIFFSTQFSNNFFLLALLLQFLFSFFSRCRLPHRHCVCHEIWHVSHGASACLFTNWKKNSLFFPCCFTKSPSPNASEALILNLIKRLWEIKTFLMLSVNQIIIVCCYVLGGLDAWKVFTIKHVDGFDKTVTKLTFNDVQMAMAVEQRPH